MTKPRRPWSKTIEQHGVRVRLYQGVKGHIYRSVVVGRTAGANGKSRAIEDRKSLKHSDRDLAEDQAKALCAAIAEARLTGHSTGRLTLGELFAAYRHHKLAGLEDGAWKKNAQARIHMFAKAWGRDLLVKSVDQTRVDAYVRARRSLEVVPPAFEPGEDGKPRRGYRTPTPPRDGTLDGDFRWLSSAFNWARGHHTDDGRRLLSENPLHDVKWPKEKKPNIKRPVASHRRFVATMKHVDAVDPEGRLRCILALARFTGRRESAICALQTSDLLFGEDRIASALAAAGMDEQLAEHMPYGAIRWRDAVDKEGFLFVSPVNQQAREALDTYLRKNLRIGDAPLFPAPGPKQKKGAPPPKEEKSISRHTAAKWLMRAEGMAEQPKLDRGTFHPYRRLWATERKHLPDVDVAAAGGWGDTRAMKLSYQKADPAGVLAAVGHGAES